MPPAPPVTTATRRSWLMSLDIRRSSARWVRQLGGVWSTGGRPVGRGAAGVCQEWETLLELCPSILEVAYKHQRLAEAVGGLEHESGIVGRELEQNAAGLAEVEGLGHLA